MCKFCIFIYPICALVKMSAICNNICYDFYADFSEVGYMKNKNSISRYFYRQNSAFSLVELLMALLVASLLLAALAPVMTRKFNDNINLSGLGDPIKAPADIKCFPYTDTNPEITLPINDVYYANFIIASGGGGGAGATSTKKVQATPIQISGTDTSDKTQTITINEYMTDIKVTLQGAGGGGAGGSGYVSPCPDGTYQFNGNSATKAFCMTKYNVGEETNEFQNITKKHIPHMLSNRVLLYPQDINGKNLYCAEGKSAAGYCCWRASLLNKNNTANNVYCTNSGAYYSCSRTLCQYLIAENSCNNFNYIPANIPSTNWSLPNDDQFIYLKSTYNSNIAALGVNSTFLCNDSINSVTGILSCGSSGNACLGSSGNACFPGTIWLLSKKSGNIADTINGPRQPNLGLNAFSARCTLDKTNLTKSYSGAGGAAGAYALDIDITGYVKQAGAGGQIIITAGKEGKGGNGATSNNTKAGNGTSGNISQILIKKKENNNTYKTIYGIRVKGGSGGYAAQNITVSGTAATNPDISSSNNCEYTNDGTNWINTSCTKNILKGSNGNASWKTTAKEGTGAISPITSNQSGYGAGGNGGISTYGYNDKMSSTNGNNGKAGYIKLTYNNELPSSAGGGGGGGSVAHIKNLYIGKTAECTLTIGKGGKGGNIDNNGMDGTLSSIKCNTDSRTFIVNGGKGGKKGTPAQNQTSNPTPGIKGEHGEINQYILSLEPDKKEIKKGLDGKDASYNKITKESIGGRGGTSGTGTKGACGGLYEEENICEVSNTDIKRIEGKGFTYEDIITPTSKDIQNNIYGTSSAGGGGGGWTRALTPGKGGDGMPGYICVYWYGE